MKNYSYFEFLKFFSIIVKKIVNAIKNVNKNKKTKFDDIFNFLFIDYLKIFSFHLIFIFNECFRIKYHLIYFKKIFIVIFKKSKKKTITSFSKFIISSHFFQR